MGVMPIGSILAGSLVKIINITNVINISAFLYVIVAIAPFSANKYQVK